MSADRKKLLWISIGLGVLVLIVLAAGFFLMAPKKGGSEAPATIGNSAPPKAQDPQDYLSAPPPAPSLEQPHSQDGGVIIVYGDKPTASSSGAPSAAGTTAPNAPTADSGSKTAVPAGAASESAAEAPPETTAPTAVPATSTKAATAAKSAAPKASVPAPKKAAPAASSKSASLKVDEYWIQAASFTSRGRADELKDSLSEKGMAAIISVKDISGKSYYRVRIGPYSGKTEADGWLGRLKELPGCAEAYVSKSTVIKKK
jgi:DedD protein